MRAKNDPLFRAKEYADFQTFVSITTPTIKDGWTVTSTTDYTLLEDYGDYDATLSKDDELRYLVELKGREKYKSNDFDTFLIDYDKIERMRAKMTDGVGGMVVEMFDAEGIAYIWTFGKSDQFNKVQKNAERNTTRQMGKTKKLMAELPHADAHVRHFPIGEHRRNLELAKQQFEI